jgi:hypothetical protein
MVPNIDAAAIIPRIAEIRARLGGKVSTDGVVEPQPKKRRKRRRMSAAARKHISEVQRKRWAEFHGKQAAKTGRKRTSAHMK